MDPLHPTPVGEVSSFKAGVNDSHCLAPDKNQDQEAVVQYVTPIFSCFIGLTNLLRKLIPTHCK